MAALVHRQREQQYETRTEICLRARQGERYCATRTDIYARVRQGGRYCATRIDIHARVRQGERYCATRIDIYARVRQRERYCTTRTDIYARVRQGGRYCATRKATYFSSAVSPLRGASISMSMNWLIFNLQKKTNLEDEFANFCDCVVKIKASAFFLYSIRFAKCMHKEKFCKFCSMNRSRYEKLSRAICFSCYHRLFFRKSEKVENEEQMRKWLKIEERRRKAYSFARANWR